MIFLILKDDGDIQRHANLAAEWWKPTGPMIALHSLNQIRVPFIRDGLLSTGVGDEKYKNTSRSLHGLHLLEVGCGAGILTEQLARIHAKMTSIDPGSDVIDVARDHVLKDEDLASRITYRNEPIELHCIENSCKYDAVIVSEVLEHVNNKAKFLENCVSTVKPGGSIFITTFNKTFCSWLGAIILAENVANLVPKGTHDWEQFISPIDVQRILDQMNCSTILSNGFVYEFWRDTWRWTRSTNLSYALHAVKDK
ncbi:Ubiquinone biosynthesis O-methyltransferase, mitochondrial [Pseudolycoriella hygida]|uniref:Ubiquinone biosynthesis O-methyltransferase, mitochondrial n=1 Tax=Pseudolycoriella hygida TaxID=35572 RepID=A0A9Q0RTJ2_9DIPT|nr:Ubiquinone biosynthesis O-methyltransferase, mitochondrial [Pseudolycoriella hygida]